MYVQLALWPFAHLWPLPPLSHATWEVFQKEKSSLRSKLLSEHPSKIKGSVLSLQATSWFPCQLASRASLWHHSARCPEQINACSWESGFPGTATMLWDTGVDAEPSLTLKLGTACVKSCYLTWITPLDFSISAHTYFYCKADDSSLFKKSNENKQNNPQIKTKQKNPQEVRQLGNCVPYSFFKVHLIWYKVFFGWRGMCGGERVSFLLSHFQKTCIPDKV